MKDKTTAALLAFFLGGFGVHRFYLGQTGLGFLYLIFCWTFIPIFIGFIDFIVFLTMSKEAFDAKYNRTAMPVMVNQSQTSSNVNQITIHNSPLPQQSSVDVPAEIEKLYALKEKGMLSESEFEQSKRKLLLGETGPGVANTSADGTN